MPLSDATKYIETENASRKLGKRAFLTVSEMASSTDGPTPADSVSLPVQEGENLFTLLGVKDQRITVRTTGEGRDKKFSLIDVAMLVSGKASCHAGQDIKKVCNDYEAVIQNVDHCQFPGERQRPTPIADLKTTLLVVLRLRSKVAQKLSAKVIDVFVRYVGGDPELAKEVLDNREFQEYLAGKQPAHPARAFGEVVEEAEEAETDEEETSSLSTTTIVLPRYLLDARPAEGPGADYLYVMQDLGDPLLVKVGHSKDTNQRRRGVQYQYGHRMMVRTVWRQDGGLESFVHTALAEHESFSMCLWGMWIALSPGHERHSTTTVHTLSKERRVKRIAWWWCGMVYVMRVMISIEVCHSHPSVQIEIQDKPLNSF